MHVGQDILIHGVDIINEVNDAIGQFKNSQYEAFGEDLGKALAQILIGMERQRLQDEKLKTAALIIGGILEGAIDAEGLDNIENCIKDITTVVEDVEKTVQDFEKKTAGGAIDGVKDIAKILKEVPGDIKDCEAVTADWEKLAKMAAIFASPTSFAYHVGKDLIVNGMDIYHEIDDSIDQYKAGQWFEFGKDIGEASAKLILGEKQPLFLYWI